MNEYDVNAGRYVKEWMNKNVKPPCDPAIIVAEGVGTVTNRKTQMAITHMHVK